MKIIKCTALKNTVKAKDFANWSTDKSKVEWSSVMSFDPVHVYSVVLCEAWPSLLDQQLLSLFDCSMLIIASDKLQAEQCVRSLVF